MQARLGLEEIPDEIHYQLIHRSASAMIEAQRFNANYAVMLIHAFDSIPTQFGEYSKFVGLFGKQARRGEVSYLNTIGDIQLFSAWVDGDPQFLTR